MSRLGSSVLLVFLSVTHVALAEDLFVGAGLPHSTVASALDAAVEGDVIIIEGGTYEADRLETRAPGVDIIGLDEVVLQSSSGRVLRVVHANITLERVILDGGFGDDDVLQIRGDGFTLRSAEVRNAGRDCIDATDVSNTLIEGSLVHHCLRSTAPACASDECRVDAHGIVGGAVRDFVVRDTEIHTFSGDALQFDPGRDDAGWSGVRVEGCRLWLEPLPADIGGFAAGVVPGENAFDTKTSDARVEPAALAIVDTVAFGFRAGLIANMAAFNMKENVRVVFDRVTVFDSEIAFRLRGATSSRPRGAEVTVSNAVIYDVDTAMRLEDGLEVVTVQHTTFGGSIGRHVQLASSDARVDSANVLVLGDVPPMLSGASAATNADFVAAMMHDYHLVAASGAVDAGERVAGVELDRDGRARDGTPDIGAYEFCEAPCDSGDGGTLDGGVGDAGLDSGRPDAAGSDAASPDTGSSDADSPADGGADSSPDAGMESDAGCGCRLAGGGDGPAALLGLVFLVFAARRRR